MPEPVHVPPMYDTVVRAALNAIPYAGGSLAVIYEDVRARHLARIRNYVLDVEKRVGLHRLSARFEEDEELEVLFLEGLEAASRTGLANKRRLLAKVVAAAMDDTAAVEHGQLVTRVLRDLEAPHIRALARIRAAEDAAISAQGGGAGNDEIARAALEAGRVEPIPVISSLIQTGTVLPATLVGGGLGVYRISDFGRNLLIEIEAASEEDDQSQGSAEF